MAHDCKELIPKYNKYNEYQYDNNVDEMPFRSDNEWIICIDNVAHCMVVSYCPHCGEKLGEDKE